MFDKKSEIFKAARALFLQKGFKEVNVSDITKKTGIAVGTFYNYYESKEKLFLEVFMEENSRAKREVVDSLQMDDPPEKIAFDYTRKSMSVMSGNLILKEWYQKDVAKELHSYFDQNGSGDIRFVREILVDLLEKWRAENKIRADIDNETILSLFDMIVYLDNHQDDVDIPDFPKTIQLLGEFVIKGFTISVSERK